MFRIARGVSESDKIEMEEEQRRARENTIQNVAGYVIIIGVINLSKYKYIFNILKAQTEPLKRQVKFFTYSWFSYQCHKFKSMS